MDPDYKNEINKTEILMSSEKIEEKIIKENMINEKEDETI